MISRQLVKVELNFYVLSTHENNIEVFNQFLKTKKQVSDITLEINSTLNSLTTNKLDMLNRLGHYSLSS